MLKFLAACVVSLAALTFQAQASQIKDEAITPVVKINENCSASMIKLDEGYRLLTAAHCTSAKGEGYVVDEIRSDKDHKLISYKQIFFDTVRFNAKVDLALLKVRDDTWKPVAVMTIADKIAVDEGDAIYTIGYPKALQRVITEGLYNMPETAKLDGNDRNFLRASSNITGGNSGGALVQFNPETQKFELIGVTDAVWMNAQWMGYYTSLADIREFLRLDANKTKPSAPIDQR